MAKVSAGPTTQIKNGIRRIGLNRIQKRRIVLTDVVASKLLNAFKDLDQLALFLFPQFALFLCLFRAFRPVAAVQTHERSV